LTEEIKFIESFGKLEIREGDTIVLKNKYKLNDSAIYNIRQGIEEYKKKIGIENLYILILEEGMEIGVINYNKKP